MVQVKRIRRFKLIWVTKNQAPFRQRPFHASAGFETGMAYNPRMSRASNKPPWNILPATTVPPKKRLQHVRYCSDFAAGLLDRYPAWSNGLDESAPPHAENLAVSIRDHGLDAGLRRFRNREMLRIVWRDLCGLAPLGETFSSLCVLAESCLGAAISEHQRRLEERHGTPRGEDGSPQRLFVIGLGKFGGGELNLSSDIDMSAGVLRRAPWHGE
jgi:glutamate-ammonia-ligase adenylyltransferase